MNEDLIIHWGLLGNCATSIPLEATSDSYIYTLCHQYYQHYIHETSETEEVLKLYVVTVLHKICTC
jgi:hypothetical protein